MANEPLRLAAIVLAAGKSARMGSNKLLADLQGAPLIRRTVEAVASWPLDRIIVITGHEADKIAQALEGLDVTMVHNADYALGFSTTLRRGIETLSFPSPLWGGIKGGGRSGLTARPPPLAPPHKREGEICDAALICLGDMPLIEAETVRRLIAGFANHQTICVPLHNGVRGNPVLWGREHFAAMASLSGDSGAKSLMEKSANDVVEVETASDGVLMDADTPEALDRVRSRLKP